MMPKPTTAVDRPRTRFVIVTMDSHLSSATMRAATSLAQEDPGLSVVIHAAETWGSDPESLQRCCADIAGGDIVVATMLFMEDHFKPVLQALKDRREHCDAMVCAMSASEVVKLTRMGGFSMDGTQSGPMALLKKLRGNNKNPARTGGAEQMKMLRRIPQFLRFVPGTAQDVRAYFLSLQYWLAGSEENILNMVRFLVSRYAARHVGNKSPLRAAPPTEYPETGVYHPRMAGRFSESDAQLQSHGKNGTVGLLLLRSYLLAGNHGHYDGVIAALEKRGLRVIPCRARCPARHREIFCERRRSANRCAGLADRFLLGGRSRLQRLEGGRGYLGGTRCSVCGGSSAGISDHRGMGVFGTGTAAGRVDHHGGHP
jgi:magnesium chelatase subunit H